MTDHENFAPTAQAARAARTMEVQINTANSIEGSSAATARLEASVRDHLLRFRDRPTRAEVHLDDDEQQDLTALVFLGRGDSTLAEWPQARQAAGEIGRARGPRYIAEIPLVSDYLEEGLSRFNETVEDYLDRH